MILSEPQRALKRGMGLNQVRNPAPRLSTQQTMEDECCCHGMLYWYLEVVNTVLPPLTIENIINKNKLTTINEHYGVTTLNNYKAV